jgi:hypothetical protein
MDSGLPRAESRGRWQPDLHALLAGLRLSPAREAEIVEELSQHLDDRYEELREAGATDADARRLALEELDEAGGLTGRLQALSQAQSIRNLVAQGELADQVGIHFIGVGEHHRPDFSVSAPEVVLAAIAAKPTKIHLG